MKKNVASRIGPVAVIAVLLASLALGAPFYNATGDAPRSVFLTLPATVEQPDLRMQIAKSTQGNWVLNIDVVAFQFTDICVTVADPVPIGHAHVIVDGQKVGTAYGPLFNLGDLPPGNHVVSVVLRGQDHRAFIGTGRLIAQTMTVHVAPHSGVRRRDGAA